MHGRPHPLKGKTVKLKCGVYYQIEDWWDRIAYREWWEDMSNPACLTYALLVNACGLPNDDEVVFGRVDTLGYLVHESELDL